MRFACRCIIVLTGMAALAGCPQSPYVDTLPTTVEEVDAIRNDADLTAQDKREEMRRLGMSETTINAYLRSERTGNQFGGDLRSALDKVQGGRLSHLTPDEVQIYGDAAQIADPDAGIPTISDAQAQIVVQLFVDESLDTADNVRDYINDPGNEIPAGIPPDLLQNLFVDFDPADVEDQL